MTRKPILSLTLASLLLGTFAVAQQPDAPPPTPDRAPGQPRKMPFQHVITMDDGHTRLRLGPPGIWWKNPDIIQKLSITPDQQKRMDDIFQQSRLQLIDLKAEVERQEVVLEPLLAANPPDTNKVLAQIDKAAQARAELEKANARMLLGIRTVLTPDQWTKLQAEERGNRRMMFRDRQRPDAPPIPGGPGNPMPLQSRLTLPPLPPTSDMDDPLDLDF
jgi:Spy/CpxP family protein refolding chaperone